MNNAPAWLPDTVSTDGNFNAVIAALYNIFHQDFVERKPHLRCMQVWHDRRVKPGETYEEGFWHLVEREWKHRERGERALDPRRAERLPWCGPLLNNSEHEIVKYWVCKEKQKQTCYVWLEDFDYIVILEKRKLKSKVVGSITRPERDVAFLKTAYHLDGESRRRHFRKKYRRRMVENAIAAPEDGERSPSTHGR